MYILQLRVCLAANIVRLNTGVSKGVSPLAAREKEGVIGGEKTLLCRGVFPPLNDGTEYKTTRRLSVNLPSQIIARVPKEVPAGAVTVIVRTKFSTGNKTLSQIREVVYGYPCKAKA